MNKFLVFFDVPFSNSYFIITHQDLTPKTRTPKSCVVSGRQTSFWVCFLRKFSERSSLFGVQELQLHFPVNVIKGNVVLEDFL